MTLSTWTSRATLAAALAVLATAGTGLAADPNADIASEITALKNRIAELEKKENENWLTEERASQIKGIVNEVLADAKHRGQFLDGDLQAGYKDGFFVQSGKDFKLIINGYVQARYTYARYNAINGRTLTNDPGDAEGFDIRRARVSFAGYVFDPAITYKLEGDFYGGSNGSFTVTDAFVGYSFNDTFKLRAGSFKVPFAKAELTADPYLGMMERPEVLFPFDPVRALGASLYGDLVKDTMTYEVNLNDGSNTNTLRRVTTQSTTLANLDNRLAAYARWQWAGAGKVADFADEADLRKDNRGFIWMLGAAAGYESQNADVGTAFPDGQTSLTLPGLSTNDSPGFVTSAPAVNGGIYRGTIDWSAKCHGWSFLTAAYFQQVNNNSDINAFTDSSGFQHAYYVQSGYMVIPQKLEIVGRTGWLLTEDGPNIGDFYTIGANYYLFGNNAKLMADLTYAPEAAYTDSATSNIVNTHEIIARIQFQVKF